MTRRGRGDGSIYFDASRSRYVGAVSFNDPDSPGKRIRRKVSGVTREEVRGKLKELLKEKDKTGTVARWDVTVEAAIRDLLDYPPAVWKSSNTLDCYRDHAARIIPVLGKTPLVRLSAAQVRALLYGMADRGYSKRTISGTRSLLVQAIHRAELDGLVTRNVARLAEMPAAKRRVSRAMNLQQMGALLALDLSPWWRAFIMTGAMLGLRPGELLGVRWEDVDLDAGVLRVRQSLKRNLNAAGRDRLAPGALKTEQSSGHCGCPPASARRWPRSGASRPGSGCASGSTTSTVGWCSVTAPGGRCGRRRCAAASKSCAGRRASARTGRLGNCVTRSSPRCPRRGWTLR